jgi:hypothetical protein
MENLDKLVNIMKVWSSNVRANYMCKGKSLHDFLVDEANIIDDNDINLDVANYYNGDKPK